MAALSRWKIRRPTYQDGNRGKITTDRSVTSGPVEDLYDSAKSANVWGDSMSTSLPTAAAPTAAATRARRRLALCLDGTSNKYAKANTNVVKLCAVLEKSSPNQL